MYEYFNQKGQIVLLITLAILFVILSISIWLSSLTIREMKIAKDIEKSAMALKAAHTGMDYLLYKTENLGESLDRLCVDPTVPEQQLDNNSEYCLEYTGSDSANPETIKSVGSFGNVKRAIFSPIEKNSEDQIIPFPYINISADPYRCGGFLGGRLDTYAYAQTFYTNKKGSLNRIDIYLEIVEPNPEENPIPFLTDVQLSAEIRDVDEAFVDDFYPLAAKPGINTLASTNTFNVISEEVGSNFRSGWISFNFEPGLAVEEGERYALVVSRTGGEDFVYWEAACMERHYYPGKGWRWDGANWQESLGTGGCSKSFDLLFISYIPFPPGGEFEESKP